MTKLKLAYSAATILLFIFNACGGGSSEPTKPAEDFKAVSTLPADGARGVDVSIRPSVTFNKGIRQPVATGQITLTSSQGPVTTTVEYDAENQTLRLRPEQALAYGASFTATVSGLSSIDGARLTEPISWRFSTQEAGTPSITVTSHEDGQRVHGSRNITLTGTLAGDAPLSSITLKLNGAPVSVELQEKDFSAPLALRDRENTIFIEAVNQGGERVSKEIHLYYPFVRIATGQEATAIFGQQSFTTNFQTVPPTAQTVLSPLGRPWVHNGALYLPDTGNNRVLGLYAVPNGIAATADFVLRQSGFTQTAILTDWNLKLPQSVAYGEDHLALTDTGYNRILLYSPAPTTNGNEVSLIIGQTNINAANASCSANRLHTPQDAYLAGGKLIVADSANNRILIWNSIPTVHGASASIVLGQSQKSVCNANRGQGVTAGGLNKPTGVWSDGKRLLVADSGNNRVLIWNSFPTSDGQEADAVIGQSNMTDNGSGTAKNQFHEPQQIDSNGNQLFVSDRQNNRVLIWNAVPSESGKEPDHVLGQADFTSNLDSPVNAASLNLPSGIFVGTDFVVVTDGGNSRYLIYLEE